MITDILVILVAVIAIAVVVIAFIEAKQYPDDFA